MKERQSLAEAGMHDPFASETTMPLVALRGARNGYVQLAPSRPPANYGELPDALWQAARAWAAALESAGARRVYWIMLSEVVSHLHLHLYPRWSDEGPRGLALFEQREQALQPAWTPAVQLAFDAWRRVWNVYDLSAAP